MFVLREGWRKIFMELSMIVGWVAKFISTPNYSRCYLPFYYIRQYHESIKKATRGNEFQKQKALFVCRRRNWRITLLVWKLGGWRWRRPGWRWSWRPPSRGFRSGPTSGPLQGPLQEPLQWQLQDPLQGPLQDPRQGPLYRFRT